MIGVVCAWCGRQILHGDVADDRVSHGICARCAGESGLFPVEELLAMSGAEFDELPFGVIELDLSGRIVFYNRSEERLRGLGREQVLGRHFFRDVAPCTAVREFEGRLQQMVAEGVPAEEEIVFVFRFATDERLVRIHIIHQPSRARTILAVKALA